MKKYLQTILLTLCLCILTACGRENSASSSPADQEFYDIRKEEDTVFGAILSGSLLGTQFYDDKPIQIFSDVGGIWSLPAGALPTDKENLLPKFSSFPDSWFLTSTGKSILFYGRFSGSCIRILDEAGKILHTLDNVIGRSVCETEEGKIYVLAEENEKVFAAELNPDSGGLIRLKGLNLSQAKLQCLGTGAEGLMLMDESGVWSVSAEENSASRSLVLPFSGTSYMDMISDPGSNPELSLRDAAAFRMTDEDSVELLWRYEGDGGVLLQTLRYEEIPKTVLRFRCYQISSWLADCIHTFNRTNERYQIVLEQPPSSSAEGFVSIDDLQDFCQRTDMEIGAGKGADLIYGGASQNLSALLEKDALEDLAPYLKRAGIHREDYFPAAFLQGKDPNTICGIVPQILPSSLWISSAVLGAEEDPNIESVINALYDYPGKGSVYYGLPQSALLWLFLNGTQDFWGAVDFKRGTCDFDTELFRKILEVAKRYGSQAYRDSPELLGDRFLVPLGAFETKSELEAQGKAAIGFFFDDGVYAQISPDDILAINADSPYKEGCWEFFAFLLQEETQQANPEYSLPSSLPTNRKAFAARQTDLLERSGTREDVTLSYGILYDTCTEEDAAEQLEIMETVHFLPLHTQAVLNIIYDEAKDYFDGLKPAELIIENINNRVQLYLNER